MTFTTSFVADSSRIIGRCKKTQKRFLKGWFGILFQLCNLWKSFELLCPLSCESLFSVPRSFNYDARLLWYSDSRCIPINWDLIIEISQINTRNTCVLNRICFLGGAQYVLSNFSLKWDSGKISYFLCRVEKNKISILEFCTRLL